MNGIKLITVQKLAPAPLRGKAAVSVQDVNEDGDLQEFSGIASKTELDRVDDIVVADGITFTNPVPLLVAHDHRQVVGRAWLKRVGDAIHFTVKMPKISEAGALRDRVRDSFLAVKHGLIDSVSIGFRSLQQEPLPGGGWKYLQSEIFELSLVVVPALPSAKINAASIKHLPGEPTTREALPGNLTREQRTDLYRGKALRVLGKDAHKPASNLALHTTIQGLRDHDLRLEARVRALEGRHKDILPATTRAHPGAVRLIKAAR